MKILAFDTTFKFCSVALMKNNKVFSLVNKGVSFQHSETIIPLIEKILSRSRTRLQDINFLSVTHGPGMFTGVRVGLSVAKGFSISLGIPIVSFSTFESVIYGFLLKNQQNDSLKRFRNILCVLSPSQKYSYYQFFKIYKSRKGFVPISKPGFGDIKYLNKILADKGNIYPLCVIGNMNDILRESLYYQADQKVFNFYSTSIEPNANDLVQLASVKKSLKRSSKIMPMYVKPHYADSSK